MLPFDKQEVLNLQHQLLSGDIANTAQTLTDIIQYGQCVELEPLRLPLILVQQLHPDESIHEQATTALQSAFPDESLDELAASFEIFRSISTYFPWGGNDYTDLQQRHYNAFRRVQPAYESLLARYPFYTEYYLDLARKLYMLFGLEAESIEVLESILRYNDRSDEAYYSLGRIWEKQEKYQSALACYQRCVALNGAHLYGLMQLGYLEARVDKNYNAAIAHYNKVLELDPYSADVNVRIAELHYELKDYERAKQFVEIALSINEFAEQALDLLGTLHWRIYKEVEKAIEIYQKGLDHHLHGDSALLLGSMAELHVECLQDYNKGRLYYEKSLRAQPKQRERLQKYINLLLTVFQDYGAIAEAYATYLAIQPNDEEIQREFAHFQTTYLHIQPAHEPTHTQSTDEQEDAPEYALDDDDEEEVEAGSGASDND